MNQKTTVRKKQDRQSINLDRNVYEELSVLQAKTRIMMKEQGIEQFRSKTSSTRMIEMMIVNTTPEQMVNLLK